MHLPAVAAPLAAIASATALAVAATAAAAWLIGAPIACAADATPGPLWDAEPTPPDRRWSETYYPVAHGAVRPRRPMPGETPEQAEQLDRAWEEGIHTYLRRVSHMVAGMNLDDEAERARHCAAMAALVHADFQHIEGRRRGFVLRTKPQLEAGCAARAFRMSGFYAYTISAVAVSPDLVQLLVCYAHDQVGDPLVRGDGRRFPNGREQIPRTAVETMTRGPDGVMRIRLHVAQDSDSVLVREGCARL